MALKGTTTRKTKSIQDTIDCYLKLLPKPNYSKSKLIELTLDSSGKTSLKRPEDLKSSQNILKRIDDMVKSRTVNNLHTIRLLKKLHIQDCYNISNLNLPQNRAEVNDQNLFDTRPKVGMKFSPSNLNSNFVLVPINKRSSIKSPKNNKYLRQKARSPVITLGSPRPQPKNSHKRHSSSVDLSSMTIKAWDVATPKYF
jgi:hypothetical protein